MESKTIIILAQLLWVASYLFIIARRFGIPPSISDTYYVLDRHRKLLGNLFVIWLWIWVGMIWQYAPNLWIEASAAVIMWVGAARDFRRNKLTLRTHEISAVVGIVLGYVGLTIALWSSAWIIIIPLSVGTMTFIALVSRTRNKIWWVEIVAFITIIGGMLLL